MSLYLHQKSRADEKTRLTSPSLEFNILTTESAPTTFYDLELSIHASSFDLPVLYLYHRGEIIGKLPGDGEFVKGKRERKPEVEDEGVDSASEDGDEGMESEDERDVERRKGLARMKWDRSSVRLVFSLSFMIADSRYAEINHRSIRPQKQICWKVCLNSSQKEVAYK